MFLLYKAKTSGERLQDHWSSGFCFSVIKMFCFLDAMCGLLHYDVHLNAQGHI